jgi:hypothetical protein
MENCSSGETSVGMYKLKEAIEKFCSDLLASHQRKFDCALAGMATWRFFSRRKVMESLLMGTGYKALQSVNYHDSRALGYVWSPNRISGICDGLDWLCLDGKSQLATVIAWLTYR